MDIIVDFFNKKYEKSINKKTLYYDYVLPTQEVLQYVKDVIAVPVDMIVDYIKENDKNETIVAADVFQFSDFEDATFRVCSLIKEVNNPGLTCLDVGKLLLNDGLTRKEGALVKYGENHAKAATLIGLLFELTHTYFLSIYGYVLECLTEEEKEQLLVRLILRNKLISRLIKVGSLGRVDMRQFLYMLSDSTYLRRRSNMRKVLSVLQKCNEFEFKPIIDNLIF